MFRAAVTRTAAADYAPDQIAAWVGPDEIDLAAWDVRRRAAHTVVAVLGLRAGGDQVVGFADWWDDGLLDMLFVHPDAAGQGLARRLVDRVLSEARQAGLEDLHTHASRTARPVFEHLGFQVAADRSDHAIRGVIVPNREMRIGLDPGDQPGRS